MTRPLPGWVRWLPPLLGLLFPVAATAEGDLHVGNFSSLTPGPPPRVWEPLRFSNIPRETRYALVDHAGEVVMRAESRTSASALLKRVEIDPRRNPTLDWSWQTEASCFHGDWRDPATDDFPLRLFVLFERQGGFFSFFRRLGPGSLGDAVLYLPDNATTTPDGAADSRERVSHVSDRVRIVPLARQDDDEEESWRTWTRSIWLDYVQLFGGEPGRVSGVAIMSDTDNSQTECVSHFGDIRFSS